MPPGAAGSGWAGGHGRQGAHRGLTVLPLPRQRGEAGDPPSPRCRHTDRPMPCPAEPRRPSAFTTSTSGSAQQEDPRVSSAGSRQHPDN